MVTLIRKTAELVSARAPETSPVGFVPTMGNLHAGHISLLERALREFDTVYFSIFVNPKQFGPNEDFTRYPRTLENDLALIEASGAKFQGKRIIVYSPESSEVYPEGQGQTVEVLGVTTDLEGALRPGHFAGVATVVHRLFELVRPTVAYFGLKDYQQYLVIRQMVADLCLPVKIIGMPIVREPSGLALSSRNQYLSAEERQQGLVLSQTLRKIVDLIRTKRDLREAKALSAEALRDPRWNYLEIRDAETLSTDTRRSKNLTVLGVFQLGTTRLLDNMQVELP